MTTTMTTRENAMANTEFILPAMVEGDFSAEELAEDMDGLQMSFPRVKIPGGGSIMFEIPSDDPDNPDYEKALEGVILYNHASCAYWVDSDDEDNTPICSSVDGKIGIGDPGGVCATCMLNQYGTAEKGAGKACKNMRVLYLLRSGEYMPLQLNLPPTSIKAFREFANLSFMLRRRAAYGSLVRIELKKMSNGKEDYSVASFRRIRDFTGEELANVKAYAEGFKAQMKLILSQRAKANENTHEDLCEYTDEESAAELPM